MCDLEWSIALLTMAFISASGAHVSMPAFEIQEDILNIHSDICETKHYKTVINISQFSHLTFCS